MMNTNNDGWHDAMRWVPIDSESSRFRAACLEWLRKYGGEYKLTLDDVANAALTDGNEVSVSLNGIPLRVKVPQ